jgi:pimeloyl-ACP methyl ester carboxylesterase
MKLLTHRIEGTGEKYLTFIHGFCESKAIWNDFVPHFTQQYKVLTLDLGGFGDSKDLLPQPCSIEALAEQVAELLRYLQIPQTNIVAHSLGGYVSLALAEKYPEFVEKLCLFHSTALADSPEKKEIRNKVIDFVQKVGVNQYIESFVTPLFYAKRTQELSEAIKFVEEIGKKTPLQTIVAVVAAMRDRQDRLHVIKNASFPILYIIGKDDGAVSFESYQEQIQANPQIQSLVLEETAHMGMFERPQETLKALKQFLNVV